MQAAVPENDGVSHGVNEVSPASVTSPAATETLSTEKTENVDNSKKICPSCGNEGGAQDAFCSRCGRKY